MAEEGASRKSVASGSAHPQLAKCFLAPRPLCSKILAPVCCSLVPIGQILIKIRLALLGVKHQYKLLATI